MAFKFMAANPALIPLFGAVGIGLTMASAQCIHYLKNSPDVVVDKRRNPEPWNRVQQHENTKLFSWNPDFWKGRANAIDPRRAFMEEDEIKNGVKMSEKAKELYERHRGSYKLEKDE